MVIASLLIGIHARGEAACILIRVCQSIILFGHCNTGEHPKLSSFKTAENFYRCLLHAFDSILWLG